MCLTWCVAASLLRDESFSLWGITVWYFITWGRVFTLPAVTPASIREILWDNKKKKGRKEEERKRERQKVVPHEEKKIHIKYPEYVMLLYRTYCVIVCLVVWEKQQRSSALRPSLLCNILKITVWGWDTTWVTTRAFKKFNIVLYNIDILRDVLIEPKVNYRYVVVVFLRRFKEKCCDMPRL